MSLVAVRCRLLITNSDLIFIISSLRIMRVCGPFAALLSLDCQASLQLPWEVKCGHVHSLHAHFLARVPPQHMQLLIYTSYHRMGVTLKCWLHCIKLFIVQCVFFSYGIRVGAEALIAYGREGLLRFGR
jgi:hypothetical protein